MDNLEYLGHIDVPTEKIKSQVMVNIIEGRHYYKGNLDTYVTVEIPSYFLSNTSTRKTSTAPSYFKTFIIDLPSLFLDNLLNIHIIITVYESHRLPSLSDTVLGRTIIGISTIWSEPRRSFHNKWLTLVDRGKHDLSIKGYLKCDLFMFYENTSDSKLGPPKPLIDDIEIDEKNLLIPNGFKMATTHLAKYSIRIHKCKIARFNYDESTKWLSIYFGEAHESTIILNISNSELDCNNEYSTVNLYPPLCPTITIKFVFSGKIVASRIISIHDFIGEDGLPCIGPFFLHFTSLKTKKYFGRILISVQTELVPSEIENTESLHIEGILPNEEIIYFKIIIFGIIFCVNQIHKTLTYSNNMTISIDYGEFNFASKQENKIELINMQTSEYKAIDVDNDFYKLSIEEDTKPCLFVITNLASFEYYTMFAMNLFFMTIYNMETCIFTTLKNFNAHKSITDKIEIFHNMLIKLLSYHQQFQNVCGQDINLRRHIPTSCVKYMKLFYEYCSEENKKIVTVTYNESHILSTVNRIEDTLKHLRYKYKSYSGPPNIILNLRNGSTIISRCQIETRHFLYSNTPEFKGKFCGKIQPFFLETEKKKNLFDGIMETLFWICPYEDFDLALKNVPGLISNTCNNHPCLHYRFHLYDKTSLQLKAHISQAALTEKCYKKYGKLNLMTRVIFNGHSTTTNVINSNLSPFWNMSILFKPTVFIRYGDTGEKTPTYAVIQICHVVENKNKFIEKVIAFTVINIKGIESISHATLDWFDISDDSEKIGKIFIAIEIFQSFDGGIESVHGSYVPLLKHVQPKHCVYRLILLCWGLRQFTLHLHKPFVRMLCSGLYVDSDVIKKVMAFPNFPNIMNIKYVLSLELPEDPNLIPPISFQLFTKSKLKKISIPIGMCASRATDHFLGPVITKTEWNKLYELESQHSAHSVVEIEEDEKPQNINKKLNKNLDSKNDFEFNCNFMKKIINCITPLCIKNIISKIFKTVKQVSISLFNTLICLCPCINNITHWILRHFEHFIGFFGNKYNILTYDEFEEDENEFNWWTKYYGFKFQKNELEMNKSLNAFSKMSCKLFPNCACCEDSNKAYFIKRYSNINSIKIYDKELENVPEFNNFEDNIKTFKMYGYNENNDKLKTIAILKGNVHLYPISNEEKDIFSKSKKLHFSNTELKIWPGLKSNDKCNIIVRIYILRAHNLHPCDLNGLSDPYVEILFGKSYTISDHKNYVPKTLNPMFGRCYEREITLPECSVIKIKIMDYDRIGKNEFIGETTIDIESRYYSKHRARCGLPKKYNNDGYNRWRDNETPSQILHKLCLSNSLKPPIYTEHSVMIGSKIFNIHSENTKIDRQSMALYVLNRWQDMPIVGYHLVPEHVETRTLHNPIKPNLHQGTLEMWIDMFSKDNYLPEMVNVNPPTVNHYEVRVIVWSVTDVKLVDDNFFTGEKHCDIYIKGWLPGIDKQSTDIHYRSLNGEGLFNWRFKFSFLYNKTENNIVHKIKSLFSWDYEEQKFLPRLHLQLWDNDHITPDSFIGYLTLDLWNMPRGTKSPWQCTTSDKVPRINLFKAKKIRGWWPFISTENNKDLIVGKIDAEIQIMTKQEADKSPAGFGRDEPQPLPDPKRPSVQYLKMFLDPFTYLFRNIFSANKTRFIMVIIACFVLLFLLLFVYAIPGYLVKKLLDA